MVASVPKASSQVPANVTQDTLCPLLCLPTALTLATAISKSSCVTCTRLSRSAYIPASVHTPCEGQGRHPPLCDPLVSPPCPQLTFTSAPDAPGISSAILRRLMPRVRFIFREWILRMSRRAWRRAAARERLGTLRCPQGEGQDHRGPSHLPLHWAGGTQSSCRCGRGAAEQSPGCRFGSWP